MLVNFEDHLRVIACSSSSSISPLKDILQNLVLRVIYTVQDHILSHKTTYEPYVPKLYQELHIDENKDVDIFQTHPVFGNLTTSIFNCGTGMDVSIDLKLSTLARDHSILKEICRKVKLKACTTNTLTDNYQRISMDKKLGVRITDTLLQLLEGVGAIIEIEKKLDEKELKVEHIMDRPHTPTLPRPTSIFFKDD